MICKNIFLQSILVFSVSYQTSSEFVRIAFGSCQKRLMITCVMSSSADQAPGCYDNHNVGSLVYDLQHKPESKRGYVLGARTAPRFLPPIKVTSPSPLKYQQDWSLPRVCSPNKAPFNSSTQRFRDRPSMMDSSPGPGAYAHDTIQGRKVSWPMKFSSPDWSRVPTLERKALRTELIWDRDFRKQRNRLAYLRLYY